MIMKVLILGDEDPDLMLGQKALLELGFELEVTKETREEVFSNNVFAGGYRVSQRSGELARGATPELYDAIIVGNNEGTGRAKARELPDSVKDRTMIVWNRFVPGTEAPYAEMGFTHFGQRYTFEETDPSILGVRSFMLEIASKLATSA